MYVCVCVCVCVRVCVCGVQVWLSLYVRVCVRVDCDIVAYTIHCCMVWLVSLKFMLYSVFSVFHTKF